MPTPEDDLILLCDMDLLRIRLKAALQYLRTDLPVPNAGGGNKGVPAIDHLVDSVPRRGWNAHMKLQMA